MTSIYILILGVELILQLPLGIFIIYKSYKVYTVFDIIIFRKLGLLMKMFKEYQLTIDKILKYALYIAPDQVLTYAPAGLPKREFTYKEFAQRVNKLGWVLEKFGVKRGEKAWDMGTRVAVMDWNTIRYQELMFAVPMYRAVLFTVNIRLAPEEIIYTMNMAEPEVLFVSKDFVQYLEPILNLVKSIKKVVVMDDEITTGVKTEMGEVSVPQGVELYEYEALLKEAPSEEYNWPDLDERVVAGLFFTSGTTGRPKGIYHTHRQILIASQQILIAHMEYPLKMDNRDIALILVPYFHIFGWMQPYYGLLIGSEMIFPGRYVWDHVAKTIVDYIPKAKARGARVIGEGVPTMLYAIIQEAKKMGVESLEGFIFGYGGEALPIAVYNEAKKMNIGILTGYGPSETLTAITRLWAPPRVWMKMGTDVEKITDYIVKKNSLGIPVPLTLVKAVDKDGNEVPHDGKTPGKILLYGPSITREYYKDPEKTEQAWKTGWFDVQDFVVIDEYGSIVFVDREKDAIKSGGEWIPSSRLEGFISTHPAVAAVAAVGVDHPKWVERPIAVVALKPEYKGKVSEQDIIEYLNENYVNKGLMPKWWIPDKIIFVDEMPRTSTGKVDKKVLRAKYKNILTS